MNTTPLDDAQHPHVARQTTGGLQQIPAKEHLFGAGLKGDQKQPHQEQWQILEESRVQHVLPGMEEGINQGC